MKSWFRRQVYIASLRMFRWWREAKNTEDLSLGMIAEGANMLCKIHFRKGSVITKLVIENAEDEVFTIKIEESANIFEEQTH